MGLYPFTENKKRRRIHNEEKSNRLSAFVCFDGRFAGRLWKAGGNR